MKKEIEIYGCVYLTTNVLNKKIYVGQSIFPEDVIKGKYKGSGNYLINAFDKYGFENFKSEIIEYIYHNEINSYNETQQELDYRESFWIKEKGSHFSTGNGYNISWGETRNVITENSEHCLSVKYKGKVAVKDYNGNYLRVEKDDPRYLSGELVPISLGKLKGIKKSEEHKSKISKSHIGKSHSKETCQSISKNHANCKGENNPNYGNKMSDINKKIVSNANKGRHTGKIFINDGTITKLIFPNKELPIGWKRGRAKILKV